MFFNSNSTNVLCFQPPVEKLKPTSIALTSVASASIPVSTSASALIPASTSASASTSSSLSKKVARLGVISQNTDVCFHSGNHNDQSAPKVFLSRVENSPYNKQHACYFCGSLQKKISRHLREKHGNMTIIIEMNRKPADVQLAILDELRLMGDFQHNVQVKYID